MEAIGIGARAKQGQRAVAFLDDRCSCAADRCGDDQTDRGEARNVNDRGGVRELNQGVIRTVRGSGNERCGAGVIVDDGDGVRGGQIQSVQTGRRVETHGRLRGAALVVEVQAGEGRGGRAVVGKTEHRTAVQGDIAASGDLARGAVKLVGVHRHCGVVDDQIPWDRDPGGCGIQKQSALIDVGGASVVIRQAAVGRAQGQGSAAALNQINVARDPGVQGGRALVDENKQFRTACSQRRASIGGNNVGGLSCVGQKANSQSESHGGGAIAQGDGLRPPAVGHAKAVDRF